MNEAPAEGDGGVRLHLRLGKRERTLTVPEARVAQGRRIGRTILREPFQRRTWRELAFFLLSGAIALIGAAFALSTMVAGIFLAVVVVGLFVLGGSLRGTRGIGGLHRGLARNFLDERIEEPEPFVPKPGLFGWLSSALGDKAAWRALCYAVVKVPLVIFGTWFALSVWIECGLCLVSPFVGGGGGIHGFGFLRNGIGPLHPVGTGVNPVVVFFYGVVLLFVAPWTMRLAVHLDRLLMRVLLGPDDMTARVRSLEQARTRTVDASAATLRRIERNLHDGTQAQLVAMAMRLGQAKEELARSSFDVEHVRRLVGEAHQEAKDAIVELRDLARGIHPPVLDTGLERALSTLTARAAVPSELTVDIAARPTPAIEAIAYFCVAELLANVTQHAHASRAVVRCVQQGDWLRIVVRDDGRGGAVVTRIGSSSSGLAGLTDRVRAVDGYLSVASPAGGPTAVTVDLPCRA